VRRHGGINVRPLVVQELQCIQASVSAHSFLTSVWPSSCVAIVYDNHQSSLMARDTFPPPYSITADDKRGLIVVTVALVLAFVYVCSLIRISLRWQSGDWRTDDWLLSFATVGGGAICMYNASRFGANISQQVIFTVQSGIVFHLVDLGLGTSSNGVPLSQLGRLGKVSCPLSTPSGACAGTPQSVHERNTN
jgi:hypothetical protein